MAAQGERMQATGVLPSDQPQRSRLLRQARLRADLQIQAPEEWSSRTARPLRARRPPFLATAPVNPSARTVGRTYPDAEGSDKVDRRSVGGARAGMTDAEVFGSPKDDRCRGVRLMAANLAVQAAGRGLGLGVRDVLDHARWP